MPRAKHVFSNDQLAHVWFSQSQPSGRNPKDSMYFRDSTIYSYGSHYPLAKIYPDLKIVAINSERYSNTTAKHERSVRRSISNSFKIIYIPDVTDLDNPDNETHFYNDLILSLNSAFSSHYRSVSINSVYVNRVELNNFLTLIKKPLFEIDPLYIQLVQEMDISRIERQRVRDLVRAEKEKREQKKYQNEIPLWPLGKNTVYIPSSAFNYGYDLIRIKPNDETIVETSNGAQVPIDHALRLLKLVINRAVKKGERVGHFTVDSISDEILTIGCHKINIKQASEILAPLLKGE